MNNTNKMIYRTGIYLRLSQGDEDIDGMEKQESNSISNQKLLLEKYVSERADLKLVDIFIDDGYSGSNFERPEFKRMMQAIEDGNLDCVIVKDLSRLARERIGADELILKTFKKYGVRFIAVTDHYDSLTANRSETQTIIPFKNLMNDHYNQDISMKVRSSQQAKRANGEFIGSFAPYGYKKSKTDKNKLVPDEYAAGIVRDIFAKKLGGMSALAISNYLNANGVLAPLEYKMKLGEKYTTSFKGAGEAKWSAKAVLRILKNDVYIGNLSQGKSTKISYKVKKEIKVPQSEWIVVPNAHEAVVSRQDFDAVQMLLTRDTKSKNGGSEAYTYAGFLYCGDCGMSMVRRDTRYKGVAKVNYICSNYNRNGKVKCSRHKISEEALNEIVLGELQSYIGSMCNYEKVLEHLESLDLNYDTAVAHDKEIAKLREELTKYSALKSSLYQDLKDGLINKEQFARYREQFSQKEQELQHAIEEQEKIIKKVYDNGIAVTKDLERYRDGIVFDKVDRLLLVTFIDRILVYENNTVEIIFKYRKEMEKVDGLIDMASELFFEPEYSMVEGIPVLELKEVG